MVLEGDPGGDPPSGDRQEAQPDGSVGTERLEQTADEQPTGVAARRRREQAVRAPASLMQVDECVQVVERVGAIWSRRARPPPRRDGSCAGPRGVPSCRAVQEPGEVGDPVGDRRRPGRHPRVRGSRPSPARHHEPRTPRRARRRPDRRSEAGAGRSRPIARDGRGRAGSVRTTAATAPATAEVGRRGQDRGVVGVVARPRRRRPWPSAGRASEAVRSHGGEWSGRRRRLGSTSWRCISGDDADRLGVGDQRPGSRTSNVWSWAFAA